MLPLPENLPWIRSRVGAGLQPGLSVHLLHDLLWGFEGLLLGVILRPQAGEGIEVAAQAEAGASPLEALGDRRGPGVGVPGSGSGTGFGIRLAHILPADPQNGQPADNGAIAQGPIPYAPPIGTCHFIQPGLVSAHIDVGQGQGAGLLLVEASRA